MRLCDEHASKIAEAGSAVLTERGHSDHTLTAADFVALFQAMSAASNLLDGWKEASIAWQVCGSIHREYAQGRDPMFRTRQADYVKHAERARAACLTLFPH